jgi:hypothetical protein
MLLHAFHDPIDVIDIINKIGYPLSYHLLRPNDFSIKREILFDCKMFCFHKSFIFLLPLAHLRFWFEKPR